MKTPQVLQKAQPGSARLEYYKPGKSEEFGLNKRTRRIARGEAVTKPDGSVEKGFEQSKG